MKRTMKRITAMFLVVVMTMSLIGITPIFAEEDVDATGSQWQIDGEGSPKYYTVGATTDTTADDLTATETGDYSITKYENDNKDGLSVSIAKTIEPSVTTENEFDITLEVVTTQDFEDLTVSPDAAVVLVFDNSMSMGYDNAGVPLYVPDNNGEYVVSSSSSGTYSSTTMPVESVSGTGYWSKTDTGSEYSYTYNKVTYYFDSTGKSNYNLNDGDGHYFIPAADYRVGSAQRWSLYKDARMSDAQTAAVEFIDSFATSTYDCSRYISVVEFAQNATEVVDWTEIKNNETALSSVKTSINNMTTSAYGGTNIDAGLTLAEYLIDDGEGTLKNTDGEDISAIYVVLLTDGAPTYYYNGGTSAITTSNGFSSTQSSKNVSGSTSTTTHTQTYDAATSLDKVADIYTVAFATTNQSTAFNVNNNNTMNIGTWLETYIASSDGDKLHIDADKGEDLDIAFTDIYNYITRLSSAWEVTDPMGAFINFEEITTVDGNVTDVSDDDTITWYLQNSTPSSQEKDSQGFVTESTYTLSYTITLDTKGTGFEDNTYYLTNGQTTLKYFFMDEDDSVEDLDVASLPTVDFLVPAVKGEAPEYTLTVNHYVVDEETAFETKTTSDIRHGSDYSAAVITDTTNYTWNGVAPTVTGSAATIDSTTGAVSGTLTEDTTVTYYYTKNNDTFTENHYVEVINGWYYDSNNGLVQVLSTNTVIKDTEGTVTYVLVDTDSTTDTIGTEVIVEAITVNNAYDYQSGKTTVDGVIANSLTATIGTDYVMNLYYDFTTEPTYSYTENHYVEINANGYYYDTNNGKWVEDTTSTDGYHLLEGPITTNNITIGESVTVDAKSYTNYTSPADQDDIIDEADMVFDFYYKLSNANAYNYAVNYYLQYNEAGYYYYYDSEDAIVWAQVTATDKTVTIGTKSYVYHEAEATIPAVQYGETVYASKYEVERYTNYKYSEVAALATAPTTNIDSFQVFNNDNVLNLYFDYAASQTQISYSVVYHLWNGTEYVSTKTEIVPANYGAPVVMPANYANLYENYTYNADKLTFNEGLYTEGTTIATASTDTLNLYYDYAAMDYNVAYWLWDATTGAYVEQTDDADKNISSTYKAVIEVSADQKGEYNSTNYTYNHAEYDGITVESMTILASDQTLNLYYTPVTGWTYTVEYFLADATGRYEGVTATSYGEAVATQYSATISEDTISAYETDITAIEGIVGNYELDEDMATVLVDALDVAVEGFIITEDDMVVQVYLTPADMTLAYEHWVEVSNGFYYNANGELTAVVDADTVEGDYICLDNTGSISTTYGKIESVAKASYSNYDYSDFDYTVTNGSAVENGNAIDVTVKDKDTTLKVYYDLTTVASQFTFTVEHYVKLNDAGQYWNGTAYVTPDAVTIEGYAKVDVEPTTSASVALGKTIDPDSYATADTDVTASYTYASNAMGTATATANTNATYTISASDMTLQMFYDEDVAYVTYSIEYYLADDAEGTSWSKQDADTFTSGYVAIGTELTVTAEQIGKYTSYMYDASETVLTGAIAGEDNTDLTITEDGMTLKLYYTPADMEFNVQYFVEVSENNIYYVGATAYTAVEADIVVMNGTNYVQIGAAATTVYANYKDTVSVETYKNSESISTSKYEYSMATLNNGEANVTGLTVTAPGMILNLFYNMEANADAVTYTVDHYVEMYNGYYFTADGTPVSATATTSVGETEYFLIETEVEETKLGATHAASNEVLSPIYSNYSYQVNGASITVSEDGDNTLELYYNMEDPANVSLEVVYVDEDGATIATNFGQYGLAYGTAYSTTNNTIGGEVMALEMGEKTISGYTFKEMADETPVDGILFAHEVITYVYSKNSTGGNYVPSTPSTTTTTTDDSDEPTTDIPDTDVPLTDIPDTDVPLTDIPDTDVPLTDIPEEDVPLVDIPVEDVPLSDIPQTGDDRNIGFMVATALVSAAGLAWLVKSELDEKKKHNN